MIQPFPGMAISVLTFAGMQQRSITKALFFVFVGLGFCYCEVAAAGVVSLADARQQLGLGIGYSALDGGVLVDYPVVVIVDPDPPLGLQDANLSLSDARTDFSVLCSTALTSALGEDIVAANGSAYAEASWGGSPPSNALDVHGGVAAMFELGFVTSMSQIELLIQGELVVQLFNNKARTPKKYSLIRDCCLAV